MREKVVRGNVVTPGISNNGSIESRNTVNNKEASWAISSSRKNQPSDIYLWGTPSVTSHQKSTYEEMFNAPIDQQREKNNTIFR